MRRRSPPICKRRGCITGRERWQLVCDECWVDVPVEARQRYSRARRARLTRIAGEIGREILRLLGRKPAGATPEPPRNAFANIARLTGDRDAMEPAE